MSGPFTETAPVDPDRLIHRCRQGDRQAFDVLVDRHRAIVYGFWMVRVWDPEEAQDMTQETFLKAYCYLDSFQGRSAFSTWLLALARQLYVDWRRRQKPRAVPLEELDPLPCQEWDWEGHHRRMGVCAALRAVPEKYREVVWLKDIEGFSYQEIAAALELPPTTVAHRLHQGRLRLRRELIRQGITE